MNGGTRYENKEMESDYSESRRWQEMNQRTITVKGVGSVSAKPDLIVIGMNLETTRLDYTETLSAATSEIDVLRAALVSVGHNGTALKTMSFNIQTKYESYKQKDEWKKRFAGYTCTHGLRLEFDFDMPMFGHALGAIAGCEATPQFNIQFSVKDLTAVKEQLLESAVKNAADKAKILAKAAGVKLGDIAHIEYSWGELRLYSETDMRVCECKALAAPTSAIELDIEPDDIDVNDNVTVVWEIA
jgi:uncharacterized protein YggE